MKKNNCAARIHVVEFLEDRSLPNDNVKLLLLWFSKREPHTAENLSFSIIDSTALPAVHL